MDAGRTTLRNPKGVSGKSVDLLGSSDNLFNYYYFPFVDDPNTSKSMAGYIITFYRSLITEAAFL
ncbi:hypothetical protein C1H76_3052 [Elsinoe australis]|uniref:Uncharacterized protein n=1 Tax=Elsinoe australis TaxID=40998 RepID=A0A4U7B423_9PEZI|nr:hypothetical protein C1H76_3052 [Elsinoe australis]